MAKRQFDDAYDTLLRKAIVDLGASRGVPVNTRRLTELTDWYWNRASSAEQVNYELTLGIKGMVPPGKTTPPIICPCGEEANIYSRVCKNCYKRAKVLCFCMRCGGGSHNLLTYAADGSLNEKSYKAALEALPPVPEKEKKEKPAEPEQRVVVRRTPPTGQLRRPQWVRTGGRLPAGR